MAFFVISLFMAWHATRDATTQGPAQQDLGVMAQVPAAPADAAATEAAPAADTAVPAAPAQPEAQPVAPDSTVPAAPAEPTGE